MIRIEFWAYYRRIIRRTLKYPTVAPLLLWLLDPSYLKPWAHGLAKSLPAKRPTKVKA